MNQLEKKYTYGILLYKLFCTLSSYFSLFNSLLDSLDFPHIGYFNVSVNFSMRAFDESFYNQMSATSLHYIFGGKLSIITSDKPVCRNA